MLKNVGEGIRENISIYVIEVLFPRLSLLKKKWIFISEYLLNINLLMSSLT